MGEYEFGAMTEAGWFSRLRSLEISGASFNACKVLSGAPAGLRHLAVADSPESGGLAGLLDSDLVGGLTSLELRGLASVHAMTDLATSPRMSGLHALAAVPQPHGLGSFSLSDGLLCDLVESPHLTRLTRLEIDAHGILPADAERFAGLSGLSRLRELTVRSYYVAEPLMRALARSPHLGGLRRLTIDCRAINCFLSALLDAPWLSSLRELRLRRAGIDDKALKAIAACDALSRLRVLELSKELISRAGAEALANSPHLGRLLRLAFHEEKPQSHKAFAPLVERFGGRFAIEYE
jgi:hypothetical protein